MNRSHLILFLMMCFSSTLTSQTQISFIDNQAPALDLYRNGMVNINGEDYLMESDGFNFRVSSIKDSIELLYEVSDYPFNQILHANSGNLNTKSGFVVDGVYLYELYYGLIRKRNILTSEIIEEYPTPYLDLNYMSEIDVVDDIIHMQFEQGNGLALYNTLTPEYVHLLFNPKLTFRSGNLYFSNIDNNGITQFNAKDFTTTILFEDEASQYFGNNCFINGQKGLIFGGDDQTRFLNADTTFLLDCEFTDPVANEIHVHDAGDKYLSIAKNSENVVVKVINKADCSVISTETLDIAEGPESLRILTPRVLNDEYVILELYYDYDYPAHIYLFDKTSQELILIDNENSTYLSDKHFFRDGDEIYCIGAKNDFFYTFWNVYSLNLLTKQFTSHLAGHTYDTSPSFGSSESENTLLLSRKENGTNTVSSFIGGASITAIPRIEYTRNEGAFNIKHLAIDEEKLVFSARQQVYLADNNLTTPEKTIFITDAEEHSNFIISNDSFEGLINNDSITYHLKYQLETDELTTTVLPDYTRLNTKTFAFSNYVFGNSFLSDKIYFDFESGMLETIPIEDKIKSIHLSASTLLLLSECDEGYCLTFFKNGSFIETDHTFQNQPKIISKNDGEFMILENIIDDDQRLSLLKNDGSIEDEILITGRLRNDSFDSSEKGALSSMMFYNSETTDLEVVMHRYEKFHSYKIPFLYGNVAPMLWYKAGNNIVIQSDDDEAPGIYVLTLGKEPKKMEFNDVDNSDYHLLFATHDDGILSLYVDSYFSDLEIIQYDIEAETLEFTSDDNVDLRFSDYTPNTILPISSTEYVATFEQNPSYENYRNSELYLFDADNSTLVPLEDLNQINQLSNPGRFIESSSYLYFSARSALDNSYQLYVFQKDGITATKPTDKEIINIKVSPNPTSNMITLSKDAKFLSIINSSGKLIHSIKNYKKQTKIDISYLNQGLYFIEVKNANKTMITSFIKI